MQSENTDRKVKLRANWQLIRSEYLTRPVKINCNAQNLIWALPEQNTVPK